MVKAKLRDRVGSKTDNAELLADLGKGQPLPLEPCGQKPAALIGAAFVSLASPHPDSLGCVWPAYAAGTLVCAASSVNVASRLGAGQRTNASTVQSRCYLRAAHKAVDKRS